MILLTISIFYPMIMDQDFFGMSVPDKSVWFGIQKLTKNVPYIETAKGVMPFLASDLIRIGFLAAFPALSLWLVPAM